MTFFLFQVASFLSAFLLFSIQPMIAKALLPSYGGSALVWGTCMVSFQALLFLGYVASDFILKRLRLRVYVWIHVGLLLAATLHFRPFAVISEAPGDVPALSILLTLFQRVGLPFFLLSFSTPVLQRWLGDLGSDRADWNPYRLFSASNLGSLMALLAYPLLMEPAVGLSHQAQWWQYGLATLWALLVVLQVTRRSDAVLSKEEVSVSADAQKVTFRALPIFVLSAAGTAMLLAATNAITFDISSAPLLWVLPLGAYLLTFIVVFKKAPWLGEKLLSKFLPWWVPLGLILYVMGRFHVGPSGALGVIAHLVILTVGCWMAHARMASLKPERLDRLTRYYLAMSAGGLCGSLLIGWVVPWIANEFIEYPIAMILVVLGQSRNIWQKELLVGGVGTALALVVSAFALRGLESPAIAMIVVSAALLVLCLARKTAPWLVGVLVGLLLAISPTHTLLSKSDHTERHRNFYGIYEVYDMNGRRYLTHGTTNHGIQNLDEETRNEPLSYYHRQGPVGQLLDNLPEEPQKIGMIGLGTGALAAYTRAGDQFDVFELDPLNIEIAETRFHYLSDAELRGAAVSLLDGDGRLLLADVADDAYDYLIVDAFSSGAIPMHLLTVEALAEFLRVTKPTGVVLLHISNHTLNLHPLIVSNLNVLGMKPFFKDGEDPDYVDGEDKDLMTSSWAMVSKSPNAGKKLAEQYRWLAFYGRTDSLPKPWTDESSNILSVFNW